MKNKIKNIFKILVVTAGCLMFASFSPSLDGRAVVVDNGVFPQGLFAKTVGYLPGDIISVTNIAGDTTIDLLVIGALDPSEGVAIMLSPEAADAMGIDRGANNIVKITKRSGQDERVYGNAVISKSSGEIEDWDDSDFDNISSEENTDAFDENEDEETPDEEEAFVEEETEEEAEEETEEADFEEEAEDEEFADEEETEESEEESPVEEEPFEEAVDEEPAEDEAEEFVDETPEELEEAEEEEEFEAEELDELPEEESEETAEEDFAEEAEDEAEPEESEEAVDETVEEESFEDEALDELPAEETAEESEETEETEEAEESVEEEPEEEELPSSEAFVADELDDLPDEKQLSASEETEEYEAIVLVPADSNPPENNEDEVEDVISEDELDTIEEEITLKPLSEEINASISSTTPLPEVLPEIKEEKKPATGSYDKYMVPSLKDLEPGKYYIQIAAYGSDENILEIINKYGSNYPITIVPMAGGKSKQILIGPVTMDEYKVVLERFKSYGFKDAFLRKIK